MYLLDTNICVYIIRKKPPEVLAKLETKSKSGIAVSSLTVAELEYGIEKSEAKEKNRISLIELLSIFTIIPFDDKDAVEYGRIRTDLEKKGTVIGDIDMLPAAQARCKELILVTNNTKEFDRVENLRLENWVDT
jgi:tRNA(fMet)-specific endonuclease VapC